MRMLPPKILEFIVFSQLDKFKSIELILLKDHLILEVIIDDALLSYAQRGNFDSVGLSFYKKIELLAIIHKGNEQNFVKVKEFILRLNKLRNRLAHQLVTDITKELSVWSEDVLREFPVVKYTKYTFRTKTVHALACIARVLMESANSL